MSIDAGQRPEAEAPGAGRALTAGLDNACADESMTPEQEAEFWAGLRRLYPLDFGGVEADGLRDEPPSAQLVSTLAQVLVEDEDLVDDLALVEVVAAWQRVAAMAHAGAARAAAALSRRACLQVPHEPVPVGRGRRRLIAMRATGLEIAIRTGCSVRSGELLVRDGRLFDTVLADTGDALARGEIDARKAGVIAERLADVPLPTALAVQDAVLPGAGRRSPAQLDRDLTRALIEVEPAEAERRHAAAQDGRRVCHPRVLPHGMAGIWAVLPAQDAAMVDGTLDAAARAARAAGDPRTIDQLRADGLVDLVTGAGNGCATGTGRNVSGPTVRVDVLVPLSALIGVDDSPGELAGYGAITSEQARALAAGGVWRRLVTDPLSGAVLDVGRTRYRPPAALRDHVVARDRTCARPGCVVPAERADLDHTVPFHGARGGPTAHHNLSPLCASDHAVKSLGLGRLEQPEPGVLVWTSATGQRIRVVPGKHGEMTVLPPERAPCAAPPF